MKELDKKLDVPITHMVVMGGYFYWSWGWPFLHFKKKYIILGNDTKLYRWEEEEEELPQPPTKEKKK